ncbi:MAG: GtrA family protein, partial [Lachnospiraceae bacterium]|nr:GtrA family protein [Lachnospiraceae bacterium]
MFSKIFRKIFSREIILYAVFGAATTLVNWLVTFLCQKVLGLDEPGIKTTAANGIAWFAAVMFAFITNRRYVFERTENSFISEMIKFYLARLFTGLFEIFLPDGIVLLSKAGGSTTSFLTGDLFGVVGGVAKAITAVIVIILN